MQPSAALKIKDDSYSFHQENTEFLPPSLPGTHLFALQMNHYFKEKFSFGHQWVQKG